MSENVDSLVLELLRGMRADMASVKDDIGTIKAEMLILRQHMAGMIGTQTIQDMELVGVKVRLDRIERRLELID